MTKRSWRKGMRVGALIGLLYGVFLYIGIIYGNDCGDYCIAPYGIKFGFLVYSGIVIVFFGAIGVAFWTVILSVLGGIVGLFIRKN